SNALRFDTVQLLGGKQPKNGHLVKPLAQELLQLSGMKFVDMKPIPRTLPRGQAQPDVWRCEYRCAVQRENAGQFGQIHAVVDDVFDHLKTDRSLETSVEEGYRLPVNLDKLQSVDGARSLRLRQSDG